MQLRVPDNLPYVAVRVQEVSGVAATPVLFNVLAGTSAAAGKFVNGAKPRVMLRAAFEEFPNRYKQA